MHTLQTALRNLDIVAYMLCFMCTRAYATFNNFHNRGASLHVNTLHVCRSYSRVSLSYIYLFLLSKKCTGPRIEPLFLLLTPEGENVSAKGSSGFHREEKNHLHIYFMPGEGGDDQKLIYFTRQTICLMNVLH